MSHSHRAPAGDPGNWQSAPAPRQPEATRYPPAPAGYHQQRPAHEAGYQAAAYHQQTMQGQPARGGVHLSAAASFWYILQCIAFGAGYLAKVPAKKALTEAGKAEMTAAEKFWYVVMCIGFGSGYFAKLPVKKALSEAWLG